MDQLKAIERAIEEISKLPSIGKKSAERLVYALLDMKEEEINDLLSSIDDLHKLIHICPICGNLSEGELCPICQNKERNQEQIMVVSYPKDIIAMEKSDEYHGLYHVLGGVIAPSKGIGIENLNINSLVQRIENGGVKEIIIATNPTVEGETTGLYLAKILSSYNVEITRLAYGLQIGGSLDYADALTLARALEGRTKL